MNEQGIRWDDLQIVLAIAETGSLSGAGRRLHMSHATVYRRLTDMEQRLGVALFHRTRSGYTQTLAGEDLAAAAARVNEEVKGAERRLAGQDLKLSGTIRVTTTDTLYAGLLSPIFAGFRQEFPDIELELVISNQLHSLSRREADVAIRPTRKPPETLVGRRVGDIVQAVYGQAQQWRAATLPLTPEALDGSQWIGPDPYMGDVALENWMAVSNRRSNTHYRLDSILAIQQAVRDGAGVAALPCYLAGDDERLRQLTAPIPELKTELWLLTHPDLRRVARMRQFIDFVATTVRREWLADEK